MSCFRTVRLLYSYLCLVALISLGKSAAASEDWPMWRHNTARSGASTVSLAGSLELIWERQLPRVWPAFHSARLQFDAGYEPIVADGHLLVASSRTDSVTAYDVKDGSQRWIFRCDGPVRFAPAVWKQSVCFGSDDGHLYCLDLKTGALRWKHRAAPSDRRLLGNRRLISVWPVRGGPVVADGRVYFAAGVWPFEGVFVYAMDISSGQVLWRNDRLGYLFGQQPHNTKAIGGLAPQGYLLINGEELVVPCSTAYPARLNRETGELIEFELPSPGRLPGGWFAQIDDDTARAIRRGKITFDDVVNRQQHEDKVVLGRGESGISRQIKVAQRVLKFDDGFPGVEGKIHSMLAAQGQLFVVNTAGRIYAFGRRVSTSKAKTWPLTSRRLEVNDKQRAQAKRLLQKAGAKQGYALLVGLEDGQLLKALLAESELHVVALDDDSQRIAKLREELAESGDYGVRAAIIQADLASAQLPQYMASLIATERKLIAPEHWRRMLPSLRPFGGLASLGQPASEALSKALDLPSLATNNFMALPDEDEFMVRRVGALPGAAQYAGNYALSEDKLVRFPLGVLWFDDTLQHFKRSPQPEFQGGLMISRPKDWRAPRTKGNYSIDYPLLPPVLSDIYTGRVLSEQEQPTFRAKLPKRGLTKAQQSYYHAPHQTTALNPKPPVVGERINPLTGAREPRAFPKMYGCDGGVDYGPFYTLRSGTAAFYDKTLESGTVFLSGPRSGCTNSIIPSGGVLNVPYFYEGCTCSYPLPTALTLVAMPESHEQWSSWGPSKSAKDPIQRVGVNFGAPGDRMTRGGTLWLDYPPIGGPSPKLDIRTVPAEPSYHYRHSLWMQGGKGWPWVAASGVEGMREFRLNNLKPGRYIVRLVFAELGELGSGERRQTITLQGKEVLADFDIAASSKVKLVNIVKEFENVQIDGEFEMKLSASKGATMLSGLELIRQP